MNLATQKQINQFLIEEVKRRYPIGSLVKSVYVSTESQVKMDSEFYIATKGDIILDGVITVYSEEQNKWAEIKQEKKTPEITINGGYIVYIYHSYINITGLNEGVLYVINENVFLELDKLNCFNSVNIAGYVFTGDEIKQIAEYFKNKIK